jgi:hypothetical protein
VLLEDGLIDADAVVRVGLDLTVGYVFSPEALSASYADLARRRLIGVQTGELLLSAIERASLSNAETREALSDLKLAVEGNALQKKGISPAAAPEPLDYLAIFPKDRARAHRAKSRARARLRDS